MRKMSGKKKDLNLEKLSLLRRARIRFKRTLKVAKETYLRSYAIIVW